MSSPRQEKILQILTKFSQDHVKKIMIDIKQNEITPYEFYHRINLPKEKDNCRDDFIHHRISYYTYYQTTNALNELLKTQSEFMHSHSEEKLEVELSNTDFSKMKTITLYTNIPIHRFSHRNNYWDIYNDVRNVHAVAHREPSYKSFIETALKIDSQLYQLLHNQSSQSYLYLLANLHHHLSMHFDPKVRWKLSSILDAFKENRCTPIAEKYIAKNLLTFIKRMTFPEFKEMTQNTDFEVMKPFHARLVKNFPPPTYAPECYLNVINKMKHKEWDYVTRLFNADSKDSPLIVKLFTKFAALDYFEDALIGQTKLSKEKMIEEMKTIFGKNIFDSEHLGKTHLQKRINDWDKVVHSRGFKLFQSEEKSVDTPQAVKQFKK